MSAEPARAELREVAAFRQDGRTPGRQARGRKTWGSVATGASVFWLERKPLRGGVRISQLCSRKYPVPNVFGLNNVSCQLSMKIRAHVDESSVVSEKLF
jgi:hypothetical protein